MDEHPLKEKLIQVLNQARCLEKRTIGNEELATWVLEIPEIASMAIKLKPTVPVRRWHLDVPSLNCPNCLNHLGYECDLKCGLTKRSNNCPNCGQVLNWEKQP